MKTLKQQLLHDIKTPKFLGSLIALLCISFWVYAFSWPPAWCTPETCDIPLTQDFVNQRVGIATDSPQVTLDINGGMRIGQLTTGNVNAITCDTNKLGTLIFDTDENVVKVCKSIWWKVLGNYSCNPLDPLDGIRYIDGEYLLGGTLGNETKAKEQLLCISNYQHVDGATGNPLTVDYKLTANIVFDATEGNEDWDGDGSADGASTEGWIPLGNYGVDTNLIFSGNFDGADHTITNLYINRTAIDGSANYQGMFGYVSSSTEISNIGLINVDITGYINVGGLVGRNGIINNSYVNGNIIANTTGGGLVGAYGTINNSYATADITTTNNYSGGLVGHNGTITNSYATGIVSGSGYSGGLVGQTGTISNSYATGNVIIINSFAGGLIGYNGTISNSYATGNVTGGGWGIGALIGYDDGTGLVTKSYALNNSILNAIGSPETNNSTDACSVGKAGCTASDIEYKAGSIKDGWDDAIWDNLATDEPKLAWEGSNADSDMAWACTSTPLAYMTDNGGGYEITSKEELLCLSQQQTAAVLGADYKLMADITFDAIEGNEDWDGDGSADGASTEGWISLGKDTTPGIDYTYTGTPYSGNFDGNNYTISNLYINKSTSFQGMFGKADGWIISNIGLVNVNISGGAYYIGGLVGHTGTINNSYVTGNVGANVSTSNGVGGLVGRVGVINNCYTTVSVSGKNNVGGLVGQSGTITNSYAKSNITSTGIHIGGLVGAYGTITNSYATGSINGASDVGGLVGYDSTINDITKSYALNNSGLDAIAYYTVSTTGENSSTDYCSVGNGTCVPDTINDNWDFATIWEAGATDDTPILRNLAGQ